MPDPDLTDRNGRPLVGAALANRLKAGRPPRPRPGAAEADALRGRQIAQLAEQNRALLERISLLEKLLAPAFASRPVPDHHEAELRAVARAVVALAAETGRQPAPDSLARRIGRADALRVLAAAGLGNAAIEGRWAAQERHPAQHQEPNIFSDDPRHDSRYVNAQVRGLDVRAALAEIAADQSNPVRARTADRALARIASGQAVGDALDKAEADSAAARYARQGALSVPFGVTAGLDGIPQQTSVVHASVPALGGGQ